MDSTRQKNRLKRRPKGGPYPFSTDKDVLNFAKIFLHQRSSGFKKDIDICLTAKETRFNKRDHAYLPALLICVSFLDFLSGLYAGKVIGHGPSEFISYVRRFMRADRYDDYDLKVLYAGLRHKVAHLSHPYFVLDTSKEPARFGDARRRIAWTIYASARKNPIELTTYPDIRTISSQPTPWPVRYDCRINVSIVSLARDARRSLNGPRGYIAALATDANLRVNFKKCMKSFYPE